MGTCPRPGVHAHGRVQVGGVSMCTAKTRSELENVLASGQAKRHVSATKMNSESSRSHLVSTIIIEATDRKTKLTTTGKLTLVDLAGSESQKKTGASGDTLKEATKMALCARMRASRRADTSKFKKCDQFGCRKHFE